MKLRILLSACAVITMGADVTARASIIDAPVPSNAYIVFDGLDWAWASPVAADGSFGSGAVDLSYQAQFGWRLPTAAELENAPSATQFLISNGNVPFNGVDPVSGASFDFTSGSNYDGAGAEASPYFNDTYSWGDYGNAPGSDGEGVVPWWGQPGAQNYSESLVVRDATVPEPSTWAMMLVGFTGLGFAGYRASRRTVVG